MYNKISVSRFVDIFITTTTKCQKNNNISEKKAKRSFIIHLIVKRITLIKWHILFMNIQKCPYMYIFFLEVTIIVVIVYIWLLHVQCPCSVQ